MHVWLYETLHQRQEAREAAARDPDVQRLPGGRAFVGSQEAEMVIPAPCMRPLGGDQILGALYERRMYTY